MKLFLLNNYANFLNLFFIFVTLGVIQQILLIVSFNLKDRRNKHIMTQKFTFLKKVLIITPFILISMILIPEKKDDFTVIMIPKTILNKGLILISNNQMGVINLHCPIEDVDCFNKISGMKNQTINEIFLMKFCEKNTNKLCKGVTEYAKQFN